MSNYQEGYLCRCCGKYHDELPMSYGSPVPDYCYDIPSEEQESRIEMNEDLCIVELEPTDHPLAIEQREGVTVERIKQIAEELCDEEKQ